jgi:hypothetical protein
LEADDGKGTALREEIVFQRLEMHKRGDVHLLQGVTVRKKEFSQSGAGGEATNIDGLEGVAVGQKVIPNLIAMRNLLDHHFMDGSTVRKEGCPNPCTMRKIRDREGCKRASP